MAKLTDITKNEANRYASDEEYSDMGDEEVVQSASFYLEEGINDDDEDIEDDDEEWSDEEEEEDDDEEMMEEEEEEDEEDAKRSINDVSDVEDEDEDDDYLDETFLERVAALKEIIPLSTRHFVSRQADRVVSTCWQVKSFVGALSWVITTSALMIGVPLVLELEREQQYVQYEKEMQLQQQGLQPQMPGQPLAPDVMPLSMAGVNPLQAPGVPAASAKPVGF
ncbi:mitochondrial import receptor subunit Tom22-domain-containing protein [Syncephalis plumigaleata]|nr:mitochondrial import receptor subunit Tom22-domain-containing protein [Syncephalis plumigaleata]